MSAAGFAKPIFGNPLIQKGRRSRLRGGQFFLWSVVVLSITAFLCLIVYLTATQRELATSSEAAAGMIIPIIIVQGVLLMLLGTGAVASGLAIERDEGLLDYTRMTPLSPTSKILGYLFGLPAREYVLFALTIPFLVWAVAVSEVSSLTILHFYLVFFTSVLVYHMTGMVAGMASSKPRLAAVTTQGMVLFLYLVLPQLSHLGLTYFEFLTIRPTLFGMIQAEIELHHPRLYNSPFANLASYDNVPFFNTLMHPTLYTLIVQGSLLVVMWTVVYRKWRNEFSHPFSKVQGFLIHAGAMFFFLGSLWQIFGRETYERIFEGQRLAILDMSPTETMASILSLLLATGGAIAMLVFLFSTPTKHTLVKGWSKARKLGHNRLPFDSDESSGSLLAVVISFVTIASCGLLMWRASESGRFFVDAGPIWTWGLLACLFLGISLFAQGVLERFGMLRFFLVGFLAWVIPVFATMIIAAAWDEEILASYVALPSPPAAGFYGMFNVVSHVEPIDPQHAFGEDENLDGHLPRLVFISSLGYLAIGIAIQTELVRWRRRIRLDALASDDQAALAA